MTATTLSRYPSAVALDDWMHSSNAYAAGGAYAIAAPSRNRASTVHFGNFGFDAPTNSTLSACTVVARVKTNTELSSKSLLRLSAAVNGIPVAEDTFDAGALTAVTMTSLTLAAGITSGADLVDGTFEVFVSAERADNNVPISFALDYVRLDCTLIADVAPSVAGPSATGVAATLAATFGSSVTPTGAAATGATEVPTKGEGQAAATLTGCEMAGGIGDGTGSFASWNGTCVVTPLGVAAG